MEAPRLGSWTQSSAREWRRSVITPQGHFPIVRLWGRNKRGVAEWFWATINTGFYALNSEFVKSASKLDFHYKTSASFPRKIDAMRDVDAKLRSTGFLLLKDKHMHFL